MQCQLHQDTKPQQYLFLDSRAALIIFVVGRLLYNCNWIIYESIITPTNICHSCKRNLTPNVHEHHRGSNYIELDISSAAANIGGPSIMLRLSVMCKQN